MRRCFLVFIEEKGEVLQEGIRRRAQGNGGMERPPIKGLDSNRVGIEEGRQCGRNEYNGKDRRLTMLHPETDLTSVGIGKLVIGVGVIFGKAGKEKEEQGKTQESQTEGRFLIYLGHTAFIRPA